MGRLLKLALTILFIGSLSGCLTRNAASTLPPVASGNSASDPADEPPVSPGGIVAPNLHSNPLITYTGKASE